MRLSSFSLVVLVTLLSCSMAGEWDVYQTFYSRMMNTEGETYSFIVNAIFAGAKSMAGEYLLPSHRELYTCLMDLGRFREAYKKKELWALKMLDASAQFPSGFLQGNLVDLGNFKECIEIDNKKLNITGTNCFVYFNTMSRHMPLIANYVVIENSVCVPSSCKGGHLQSILYRSLNTRGFNPAVAYCQNKQSLEPSYGTLEIVILTSFGILGVILLIGTGYDILLRICIRDNSECIPLMENGKDTEERSKLHRTILSFSLLANTADLFKTDTGAKSIKCLYGLRFLSACFIISIHRMLLDPQPISNSFLFETELRQWYRAVQLNAYVFVDLFFLMSGLLISYKYSSSMRGKLKMFYYYIHRYIRLTPPLLVCVMLELISPMFCDGPYCEPVIHRAKERCLDNAIYTLTYINNFIKPAQKCLLHSWYLSADMQMYFLAPILILFLKKWRRSIPYILLSCLAASILSTFIISYIYQLNAGYIGDNDFYETDSKLVYEPFYTRAGPWLIGFALGIILQSYNKEPYRLKKKTVTVGWIIAVVSLLVALFGVYPFVQSNFTHDRITDSLYKAFHRSLFGLGGAWIIYVCYTGQSEILNQILSSPALQPLGKVSYCLYIIHPFVQILQFRSITSNRKYSDFLQGSLIIGDICYAVVFAIFLHLTVEAPTLKLENIFLASLRGDNAKNKDEERLEMYKSNGEEKGQVDEAGSLPTVTDLQHVLSGICVPSSCSHMNLIHLLMRSSMVNKGTGLEPVISRCQTRESSNPRVGFLEAVVLSSFGVLGALVLIGTVLDIYLRNNQSRPIKPQMPLLELESSREFKAGKHENYQKGLLAFSFLTNGKELFQLDTANKSIKCLYGLRFFSACFILSIHRMLFDPQPFSNIFAFETEMRKWYRSIQLNAYLFVDVFFVMSGLLLAYRYSSHIKKGEKLNLVHYYLHRYIRLTPPLLAVVMLDLLLGLLCDGPYCIQVLSRNRDRCIDNAVYTLTYLNNMVDSSRKCVAQSWYLSADMQIYALAPILFYFLKKYRRTVPYLLLLCLLANILIIFSISYRYGFKAGYMHYDHLRSLDGELIYYPFYTRMGPWLIGFALGLKLQNFNNHQYQHSKRLLTYGWILAIFCILIAIFGVYPFNQIEFQHDRITDSLFKAFYRNLFGLGFAWLIYVCHTGHCNVLNRFLSTPVLQVLGKLSYSFFLIHPFVQFLQYRSVSEPRKYSDFLQGSILLGDVFYSLVFATILHLAVEAPTLKLEKIFFENSKLGGANRTILKKP